jgi:hypothetical protein
MNRGHVPSGGPLEIVRGHHRMGELAPLVRCDVGASGGRDGQKDV